MKQSALYFLLYIVVVWQKRVETCAYSFDCLVITHFTTIRIVANICINWNASQKALRPSNTEAFNTIWRRSRKNLFGKIFSRILTFFFSLNRFNTTTTRTQEILHVLNDPQYWNLQFFAKIQFLSQSRNSHSARSRN